MEESSTEFSERQPRQAITCSGQSRRPSTTRDLLSSELRLLKEMQRLRYGRFESVRIRHGEAVLDPWPKTVRQVKFGNYAMEADFGEEYELKQQVAQLFGFLRSIETGELRVLDFRHGLPFSMEVAINPSEGTRG
jgi:hypothetical protein